jgi:putative transcriptional regulator
MKGTSEHVDSWIPELVLGTLDGSMRAAVEAHLEACARCAGERAATEEALSLLALSLPPEPPHPSVRTEVLAAVVEEEQRRKGDTAAGRFAPFVERLARFFDVTAQRARALLELASEPLAWTPGPTSGISLIHLQGGPRFARADAGIVRLAPGARFPRHRHNGDEFGLILEGGFIDADGTVVRRGEQHDRAAGTSHDFVALPEGCTFAAVVIDGIEFLELVPDGPAEA